MTPRIAETFARDTLVQLEAPSDAPAPYIICQTAEGILRFFTIPFAPGLTQHPGPGGVICSAFESDYRIAVTRNGGADTVRVIQRPLPAEPLASNRKRPLGRGRLRDRQR